MHSEFFLEYNQPQHEHNSKNIGYKGNGGLRPPPPLLTVSRDYVCWERNSGELITITLSLSNQCRSLLRELLAGMIKPRFNSSLSSECEIAPTLCCKTERKLAVQHTNNVAYSRYTVEVASLSAQHLYYSSVHNLIGMGRRCAWHLTSTLFAIHDVMQQLLLSTASCNVQGCVNRKNGRKNWHGK